jgi:hypothetical protein
MVNKSVLAALSGGLMFGCMMTAQAGATTIIDEYWGGRSESGPAANADVFGGDFYNVDSMTAIRENNNLMVTINTNYVDHIGDRGTFLGSLFIGSGPINYAVGSSPNGGAPRYDVDTYLGDTGRFGYVFDFDDANRSITGGSGTGSLYKISGSSQVLLSTVRLDQAVDQVGGTDTGVNGSWKIGAGTLSFNIADFFKSNTGLNSSSLILAWTMSCANDVIIGSGIDLSKPGQGNDVPLPAGAWLLMSGVAGMGYMKRRAKKNAA